MREMKKQIASAELTYGGITSEADLMKNLEENCVPVEFMDMDVSGYQKFLEKRRELIAKYIRRYYESLN